MTAKQTLILVVGALVIAAGVYTLFFTGTSVGENAVSEPQNGENVANPGQAVDVAPEEAEVIITRTDDGYEPENVTVSKGDIVLWQNESSEHHWPASDVHPTHRIYSEFDPKRPVEPGEDWAFQFERVGEWRFHDHLRANLTGVVTVTEE